MAKKSQDPELKAAKTDLDLFDLLAALDRKDTGYYQQLSTEQQQKFVPYMLLQWHSSVQADAELADYYLRSTDYHANHYMFNERVQQHPELQYLMLTAVSPGMGRQRHAYVPQLSPRIREYREPARAAEIRDYFAKIAITDDETVEAYVQLQHRRTRIAKLWPTLKRTDIELLSEVCTDAELDAHERELGF